ncbi:MAG: DUF1559 domain-containing protein, partial [Planctomycetia bacterium]|nr:DUF1559 domain-containing protein [Planctomycetia bacterium]
AIAIIGTLMSLLLPAVQFAREAGRRSRCLNGIKQLALGLHSFHEANRRLPNGLQNSPQALKNYKLDGSDDDEMYKVSQPGSWQMALLSFVEQAALRDSFNSAASIGSAPNRDLIKTSLPEFVCPSDPGSSQPVRKMCGGNGFFGKDSAGATLPSMQMAVWYAPSFGPVPSGRSQNFRRCEGCYKDTRITQGTFVNYCCHYKVSPHSSRGQLGRGGSGSGMFMASLVPVRFNSATDGLSKTMLLCETLPDASNHNGFFGGAMAARTNIPINTIPSAADLADWEASGGLCASGAAWSSPSGRHGSINAFNESIDHYFSGIKSRHPNGAVVAMADGSARFLDEITDVYVLVALGSRNLGAQALEPTTLP